MYEKFYVKVIANVLLGAFAVGNPDATYHQSDTSFNIVKQRKGELIVDKTKHVADSENNLILCNDTSISEYMYLL